MDYQKHYNSLIDKARNRQLECYTETHHIIPRCLGGDDSTENLVRLTAEEHYIAHLLLVKIHPKHHGLVWAAVQMTGHGNGKRTTNKMYGWLKKRHQRVAKARTGDKNGVTGTCWINKIGTTENRRIRKDEPIPEGWERGRTIYKKRTCRSCNTVLKFQKSTYCSKRCFQDNRDMESSKTTKLDWKKVRTIRQLYQAGDSVEDLSVRFEVSKRNIQKIIYNESWKEKQQ